MSSQPATKELAALSRELSDFLVELSIGIHKHAIYPEGHPLLATAGEGLAHRIAHLLDVRDSLSLGVAREQLVIEGVATDPGNILLRDLAQRLHRHHVGAIRFTRGVTIAEVVELLRTLAVDPQRADTVLGHGPEHSLRRWEHIRLFSLTFEHLELLEGEEEDSARADEEADPNRFRPAQLWIGLARAALKSDSEEGQETPSDPAIIAKAIEQHSREQAYDQVIVGYLLQIATELQRTSGAEAAALRRRVSRLVASLRPDTLRQLLEMGGDAAQRHRFVLDAAQGMAVDAVVELVRAASESSGETVSHALFRMFTKLAAHAREGPPAVQERAESALRENVSRLVKGWALPDPNPDEYRQALTKMARAVPALSGDTHHAAEPERLIEMSLELGTIGVLTLQAVETMMASDKVGTLVGLLEADSGKPEVKADLWRRIATPDLLRRLLESPQPNMHIIEKVALNMVAEAVEPLLEALESAKDRTVRARLLDLLVQMGPGVGATAIVRLDGTPWYVQRNILVLLSRLPDLPEQFAPEHFAKHPDARVRREAVKLLLKMPALRERTIIAGLADEDSRVVHLALGAAVESCPEPAARILLKQLRGRNLEPEMRVLAIRALAPVRLPSVFEELIRHLSGGRTLLGLGRRRLAQRSPTMLAALAGLAAHWSAEPKASEFLALAAASPEPDVRAAAAAKRP